MWLRLLGFDSRLRSETVAHIWPRIDPALGFASCRVAGTIPCIREGPTPLRIISLRGVCAGNAAGSQSPIRSWASGVLPDQRAFGDVTLRRSSSTVPDLAELLLRRRAPALQRIDGADALPFLERTTARFRIGSLSEVLHRP